MTRIDRHLSGSRWLVAVAAFLLAAGGAVVRGADADPRGGPPKAAWEVEVEAAITDQTAEIEDARRRKTMAALVEKYGSRMSREPTPLNKFLYGRAQYYNDNPIGARQQMTAVLKERPDFYFARVRLAMLLADLKNYPEAEREASEVLRIRPGHREATAILIRALAGQRKWERAGQLLRERLDRDPADDASRFTLVNIRIEEKKFDEALADLKLLRGRDPENETYRFAEAACRVETGAVDQAIPALEALSRLHPERAEILETLALAYEKKQDAERLRATLERLAKLLPEARRAKLLEYIDRLKQGFSARPAEASPKERKVELADVFAAATGSPDARVREKALRIVYEGAMTREVGQVPGEIIVRLDSMREPDPACRAWVVLLHGTIHPPLVPILAIALWDPERNVRMLAADTIGELRAPVGLVYLMPLIEKEFPDLAEYQSVRAALSLLTGFSDLPQGVAAVTTAEQVTASREAWRRWWISDASTEVKMRAVDALVATGRLEPSPERHLVRFVADADYQVMRSAYRAMRDAVAAGGGFPPEKKMFPQFPRYRDEEVTRAAMRSIQDRVTAWWEQFVAERRAYNEAKGATGVRTSVPDVPKTPK